MNDSKPQTAASKKTQTFAEVCEKANAGDVDALIKLGAAHSKGIMVAQSHTLAFKYFLMAAQAGDVRGKCFVGGLYYQGQGVDKNVQEARKWLTEAFKGNCTDIKAKIILATLCNSGQGGPKDLEKAFQLYLELANSGEVVSQYTVGMMLLNGEGTVKNVKQGFDWLSKSANQGNLDALGKVAHLLEEGKIVPQDLPAAFKWFLKLAEKGNRVSQFNVALSLYKGRGVEQNLKEAFNWFLESANRDFPEAIFFVAKCYIEGLGVEHDKTQSLVWSLKALDTQQGGSVDLTRLDEVIIFICLGFIMSGKYPELFFSLLQSCQPQADLNKGEIHYKEAEKNMVIKNYRRAFISFCLAAKNGHKGAIERLNSDFGVSRELLPDEPQNYMDGKLLTLCVTTGEGSKAIFFEKKSDTPHSTAEEKKSFVPPAIKSSASPSASNNNFLFKPSAPTQSSPPQKMLPAEVAKSPVQKVPPKPTATVATKIPPKEGQSAIKNIFRKK